jgi:hypothetical protein
VTTTSTQDFSEEQDREWVARAEAMLERLEADPTATKRRVARARHEFERRQRRARERADRRRASS